MAHPQLLMTVDLVLPMDRLSHWLDYGLWHVGSGHRCMLIQFRDLNIGDFEYCYNSHAPSTEFTFERNVYGRHCIHMGVPWCLFCMLDCSSCRGIQRD